MPRVHTQKANKDYPQHGIEKGQTYYWWKFRNSGKIYSATPPKRSQLTQSAYLSEVYDLIDDFTIDTASTPDDAGINVLSEIEHLKERVEELMNQCEDSLSNMPEHLQDTSPAGETLQSRIDVCQEVIDALDSIDTECEIDEPEGEDTIEDLVVAWIEEKEGEVQDALSNLEV